MKSGLLKNKTMNDSTYKLRRKVIKLVYEAKKLIPDLPRVAVRITDNHADVRGCAFLGKNIIWITENFVASRPTVFHEILHAVYGQKHNDKCPLMTSKGSDQNLSKTKCDKLFIKYARKTLNENFK